jgi:hypothetical protein
MNLFYPGRRIQAGFVTARTHSDVRPPTNEISETVAAVDVAPGGGRLATESDQVASTHLDAGWAVVARCEQVVSQQGDRGDVGPEEQAVTYAIWGPFDNSDDSDTDD